MSKIDELRAALERPPKFEVGGHYVICDGGTMMPGDFSVEVVVRNPNWLELKFSPSQPCASKNGLRKLSDLIDLLAQAKERGMW